MKTIEVNLDEHFEEKKDEQQLDDMVNHLEPLIQQMKHIHDMAVVAYTPLVDDLCSRKATQNLP